MPARLSVPANSLSPRGRGWYEFKRMLNAAFPKKGTNLEFNFTVRDEESAN